MATIVNQVEIIDDAPAEEQPADRSAGREPDVAVPEPDDILRVERIYRDRQRRLRAD